jgi:hypothetical protein
VFPLVHRQLVALLERSWALAALEWLLPWMCSLVVLQVKLEVEGLAAVLVSALELPVHDILMRSLVDEESLLAFQFPLAFWAFDHDGMNWTLVLFVLAHHVKDLTATSDGIRQWMGCILMALQSKIGAEFLVANFAGFLAGIQNYCTGTLAWFHYQFHWGLFIDQIFSMRRWTFGRDSSLLQLHLRLRSVQNDLVLLLNLIDDLDDCFAVGRVVEVSNTRQWNAFELIFFQVHVVILQILLDYQFLWNIPQILLVFALYQKSLRQNELGSKAELECSTQIWEIL